MINENIKILVLFALVVTLGLASTSAQETATWSTPRTSDGQPDLQGIWANNSATPMERPEQLGDKLVLSDEELAELTQKVNEFRDSEQAGDLLGDRLIQQALGNAEYADFDVVTGNYNAFWLVERTLDNRTSLIIDPPNGRIPSLTPGAQKRAAENQAYASTHPADGPEDRGMTDRCIHFETPWLTAGYNGYFQILQTQNHVAILQEMGHISRLIPLNNQAELDENIRLWTGNPRGRWEGNSLVVESQNYSTQSKYNGASDGLVMVERYTRTGPDTLKHEITLNDPTTWTQPWTFVLILDRTKDPIFEYACHEGNYSMPGILGGAREDEKTTASH